MPAPETHSDDQPAGASEPGRSADPLPWWTASSQAGDRTPDPLTGIALPPPIDVTECAEAAPAYGEGDRARRLRLDEVGQLLAALPALVGFYPQRSLVVAVLGPEAAREGVAEIRSVLRFDLEPVREQLAQAATVYARCTAQIASNADSRDVLMVMVDDRLITPGTREVTAGFCAEPLTRRVVRRFENAGLRVGGVWAAKAVAAGTPWWSLVGAPRLDTMPDPAASAVAVANVLDGRPILHSRDDLVAVLAPDEKLRARVAEEIGSITTRARTGFVRALRRGDVLGYRRRALEYVLLQIAATESGDVPEPEELAAAAVMLRERAVRDSLFGLAVGECAGAAERLWLLLARACTGTDRADPATLAAYCAYVRGDGPLAGIAIEAALDADPAHSMALLLDTALRAGMRPSHLRRLARSGYDTAACLGVDLGPMMR